MNLATVVRDILVQTNRGLTILRHMQGAAQGDDLRALETLETIVEGSLDLYRSTLSRACAPWFEVRQ